MKESTSHSIVVENLTKHYGDTEALGGIDFGVAPGEVVGFIGPNGAGKTTTMKILTCYTTATSGKARVAGYDVHDRPDAVRRNIGYLPENVPLYEEMLVYDYLNFVAELQEVDRNGRRDRICEIAEMTGVDAVLSRPIRELSKGFRQRVGLAQAIIHEPEVIILDEPTTGLDPNQIVEIRDVITTIGADSTILLSTHILQEISAVCDRIIIIDDGEIAADDTIEGLQQQLDADDADLEQIFRAYTRGDAVGTQPKQEPRTCEEPTDEAETHEDRDTESDQDEPTVSADDEQSSPVTSTSATGD